MFSSDPSPEEKAIELLRLSRAYCATKLPWFGSILYRCRIWLAKRVRVAAIDRNLNIYFNPASVRIIRENHTRNDTLARLGFLWIHEISHILREHGERNEKLKADPLLWNLAADMEINDSRWEGLVIPEKFPAFLPSHFQLKNGHIAEYYLKFLKKQPTGKSISVVRGEMFDEGSGVHNQSRPWEMEDRGKIELSKVDLELLRGVVAREMHQADLRGSIPGGWRRWAEKRMTPGVDWRKLLKHKLRLSINNSLGARVDYSFIRPSRRQTLFHPIYTPSLRGGMEANVAVVIDTSGSMNARQLGQGVAEVCKILETFQLPVTVIPCDARAYEPVKLNTPGEIFKIHKLEGGGGTDMNRGIEKALELTPKPDTILVLTDGGTPYPEKKKAVPVIFGIIDHRSWKLALPPDPPWGKEYVVMIELFPDR